MLVKKVIVYDTVSSTMDIARNLEIGDVVVALSQTSGRGRKGRSWYSPRGGLYLTIVTEKMTPCRAVTLSSVGVVQALNSLGIKASIKWPNDVIVDKKKISGILSITTENKTLIGIGVNVSVENFPSGINATSLLLQGVRVSAFRFLFLLLKNLTRLYSIDQHELFEMWKSYVDLKDRKVLYDNSLWEIVEIDDECNLVIRRDDKTLRVSSLDDIKLIYYDEDMGS